MRPGILGRGALAAGLAAGALALAPAPIGAQPGAERWERPVAVLKPGWVRIPLGGDVLAELGPLDATLRLLDPEGREVPYAWSPAPDAEHAATLVDAVAADGGTRLVFDVGPNPPRHDGLRVLLRTETLATGVLVEGSDDQEAWTTLGGGAVVRLGGAAALTRLDYDPTPQRYLRLTWPDEAGVPPIEQVTVRVASGALPSDVVVPLAVTRSDEAHARLGPVSDEVRFVVPALAEPAALAVTWRGGPTIAFALSRAHEGAWAPPIEGLLDAAAEPRQASIPLVRSGTFTPFQYRLEVWDGTADGPEIVTVAALSPARAIEAHVDRPGTYRIAYGGLAIDRPSYAARAAPAGAPVAALEPGPASAATDELALVVLPMQGAPLEATGFTLGYDVSVPASTRPGAIARLELPVAAYAPGTRGDPRLLHEGLQVPFVTEASPDPVVVAEARGAVPSAWPGSWSAVTITLPGGRLPLSQLEIAGPARLFTRHVEALVPQPDDPETGLPRPPHVLGEATWGCPGASRWPCRLGLPLALTDAPALVVAFDDGDNAPLGALDLRVYRRLDAVRFAWPGDGVVLLLGHPALAPPRYDLHDVAEAVRLAPAVPATAALRATSPTVEAAGAPPELERAVFLAILAVAALGLLLVLRATMGPAAGSEGTPADAGSGSP